MEPNRTSMVAVMGNCIPIWGIWDIIVAQKVVAIVFRQSNNLGLMVSWKRVGVANPFLLL
jgi:hypothetical protein